MLSEKNFRKKIFIRKVVLPIFRKGIMSIRACNLTLRRMMYGNIFAPAHYIFYISPEEIVWLTNYHLKPNEEARNRNFPMESCRGTIKAGNWDTFSYRFDTLTIYQAIVDRINKNTPWRQSEFFDECMRDIKNGRVLWGCHNDIQLDGRLNFVDKIIENMTENGYCSGADVCLPGEDGTVLAKHPEFSDEVTINIGRSGDFFFQDGRHRLAIAKALKIEKISVKILVRHTLWHEKLKTFNLKEYEFHPDVKYLLNPVVVDR